MLEHAAREITPPPHRSEHLERPGRTLSLEGNDPLDFNFQTAKPSQEPDFVTITNAFEDQKHKLVEIQSSLISGTMTTYDNTANGDVAVTTTDQKGKVLATDNARMDEDGNVVVEHISDDAKKNYRAVYDKDGSLTVDWVDGRHMVRREEDGVVHTEMTGPHTNDNYKAAESSEGLSVTYADGSGFEIRDGKFCSTLGGYLPSIDTQTQLAEVSRLSTSKAVAMVRKNHELADSR